MLCGEELSFEGFDEVACLPFPVGNFDGGVVVEEVFDFFLGRHDCAVISASELLTDFFIGCFSMFAGEVDGDHAGDADLSGATGGSEFVFGDSEEFADEVLNVGGADDLDAVTFEFGENFPGGSD